MDMLLSFRWMCVPPQEMVSPCGGFTLLLHSRGLKRRNSGPSLLKISLPLTLTREPLTHGDTHSGVLLLEKHVELVSVMLTKFLRGTRISLRECLLPVVTH